MLSPVLSEILNVLPHGRPSNTDSFVLWGYSWGYFRDPQCQRHPSCTSLAWTLSLLAKQWDCALSPRVWQSTRKESFHPWGQPLEGRTFQMSEVCLTSKGPTSTAHSHSYLPAQPPEVSPEGLPTVSLFRYGMGLKHHLLRNPGNTFWAVFVLPWRSSLGLMGKKAPSLLHGEKGMPNSVTTPCGLGSLDIDSEEQIFMEEVHWGMQAGVMPVKKWRARMGHEEAEQFHQPSAATPGSSESGWALHADCPHGGINSGEASLSVSGNASVSPRSQNFQQLVNWVAQSWRVDLSRTPLMNVKDREGPI